MEYPHYPHPQTKILSFFFFQFQCIYTPYSLMAWRIAFKRKSPLKRPYLSSQNYKFLGHSFYKNVKLNFTVKWIFFHNSSLSIRNPLINFLIKPLFLKHLEKDNRLKDLVVPKLKWSYSLLIKSLTSILDIWWPFMIGWYDDLLFLSLVWINLYNLFVNVLLLFYLFIALHALQQNSPLSWRHYLLKIKPTFRPLNSNCYRLPIGQGNPFS